MTTGGGYQVAGHDITDFVTAWVAEVAKTEGVSGLLSRAQLNEKPGDAMFFGMAGLMQHIGPRVWGEAGSDEELLLFAVLAAYQDHVRRDLDFERHWAGVADHVAAAFAYVEDVGVRSAAASLRRGVADRATPDTPEVQARIDEALRSSAPTLAARAAHDQNMAQADRRDLRAAKALDGTDGDLWEAMPRL